MVSEFIIILDTFLPNSNHTNLKIKISNYMEITLFTFSFLLRIYFMWIDIILSALQLKLDDKRPRINVAFIGLKQ